jgi:hypothetical protein
LDSCIRIFRPYTIWMREVILWFFFISIARIAVNHTPAENGTGIPILLSDDERSCLHQWTGL